VATCRGFRGATEAGVNLEDGVAAARQTFLRTLESRSQKQLRPPTPNDAGAIGAADFDWHDSGSEVDSGR